MNLTGVYTVLQKHDSPNTWLEAPDSWELECHQAISRDYPVFLLQKHNSDGYYAIFNLMMADQSQTETFLSKTAHLLALRKTDYPCVIDTGMFMAPCRVFLMLFS